jgi:hypothetical protein
MYIQGCYQTFNPLDRKIKRIMYMQRKTIEEEDVREMFQSNF